MQKQHTVALAAVLALGVVLLIPGASQAGERTHTRHHTKTEKQASVRETQVIIKNDNENKNDNSNEVEVTTGDVTVKTGEVTVHTTQPAIAGVAAVSAPPVPITAKTGAGTIGVVATVLGGAGLVHLRKKAKI